MAYVGLKMRFRAVLGHCLFLTLVMYTLKKSDRIIKELNERASFAIRIVCRLVLIFPIKLFSCPTLASC